MVVCDSNSKRIIHILDDLSKPDGTVRPITQLYNVDIVHSKRSGSRTWGDVECDEGNPVPFE